MKAYERYEFKLHPQAFDVLRPLIMAAILRERATAKRKKARAAKSARHALQNNIRKKT